MKKLIAVLLAATLALSLAACGKKEANPATNPSPLPSAPAQQAPEDEKEDKSQLDPFEIEAVTLTECLVKSIDDISSKGKVEFDYEDFMILLALVEDDDFTYYGYAPANAKGDREFIPERCEIIAYQIFGKEIPASELMDDDFYDKSKDSYIVPDGIGIDCDYMAENLSYSAAADNTSCTVTFELLEEKDDDGDPAFVNIGKASASYVINTEKGGAYWTLKSFTLL